MIPERLTPEEKYQALGGIYNSYGLLPYGELPDITDPSWHPRPLVVEREIGEDETGDRRYLLALGLAHRSDRGNPHHLALLQYGASFMFCSEPGKRVMLHEGGPWPIADSLDQAYAQGGEPMWMVAFARGTNTELIRAELPSDGADLLLATGFSREEIACYYFVRQVPQWERLKDRPAFENYIKDKMGHRGFMLGWDFDFSFDNLVDIYEDMYQKRFDRSETRFFLRESVGYMLPDPSPSRIRQAAIACNMGRDINLLNTQLLYLSQGMSVWTAFGWSHIEALVPALKKVGRGETTYLDPKSLGNLAMWNYELDNAK